MYGVLRVRMLATAFLYVLIVAVLDVVFESVSDINVRVFLFVLYTTSLTT